MARAVIRAAKRALGAAGEAEKPGDMCFLMLHQEPASSARPASIDWQRAHAELTTLARTRAGLDAAEGRWLLTAFRLGCHARLGYGSFREYVGRLFGYDGRLIREKLRVAEALEG